MAGVISAGCRALSNLAHSLRRRAEQTGESADFDAAVRAGQEALDGIPVGHDDAAQMGANLAGLLCSRFEHGGDPDDLDRAVEMVQEVPNGTGPATANHLAILGRALTLRHQRLGSEPDLGRAVAALTRAAGTERATPIIRVWTARDAADLVKRRDPVAAALLLEGAVTLVARIASRHLDRHDQEFALRRLAGLATDAAALVLLAGRGGVPDPAPSLLGLLELGR